jgi:hypothetical protein
MEMVSVQKWMVITRLGLALARAQGHPIFRISLSFCADIIYLIQYVVCQGKLTPRLRFAHFFG